jgi:hypothetical protein
VRPGGHAKTTGCRGESPCLVEALVNSARDNLTIEIDSIYAMNDVHGVDGRARRRRSAARNDDADDRATCASGQVKSAQAVGPWSGDGMLIGARR